MIRLRHAFPFLLLTLVPPLHALLDRNGDGVSDLWYLRHPTSGAPTADPDGDGATNRDEAIAGTDPSAARSRFAATPQRDAGGILLVRWPSVVGKHYHLESSIDLRTWTALAGDLAGTGADLSAPVPAAGGAKFWRVVVADADTDADGLTDWEEAQLGTSSSTADSDHDGLPDFWEASYGLDPTTANADANPDGDDFNNLEEFLAGLDPTIANAHGSVALSVHAPTWGFVGTQVTLTGSHLTGATAVRFNGTAAITFTVDSPDQITVTVPAGATTGRVAVTTPEGSAVSPNAFLVTSDAACLRLAQNARASVVLVAPESRTMPEDYALTELSNHLAQVTGATFTIVDEATFSGGQPAIFLGQTAYAARHGIDFASCGDEELIVKTVDGNLVLTGGRPRGTLYAVYEFLERVVGCHWLAWDTTVIPNTPSLRIPPLDIHQAPPFSPRELYNEISLSTAGNTTASADSTCLLRNRGQIPFDLRSGGFLPYYHVTPHTFYRFVDPAVWFDSHPEYFSMNAAGVRTCGVPVIGAAESGLCLTNPAVATVAAASIATFVDTKRAQYLDSGLIPSDVVDLSVEDNAPFLCLCPNCVAFSTNEGSEGGLLVDFLDRVAAKLQATHPGLRLRSLAYGETDAAPLHARPSENVIMWWTDDYSASDCYRPLTHPINRGQFAKLTAWTPITPHLQLWDYWNMGNSAAQPAVPQFIPVATIAADMGTFRTLGVDGFFTEYEVGACDQSFYALGLWAGRQLTATPDLPVETLLRTFMSGYYGPAAAPMRQYHNFLEAALRDEPGSMKWSTKPSSRTYVTMEFLLRCRDLLLAAEQATTAGSLERLHVWQERIVVDNCLLNHWQKLVLQAGHDFPFTRDSLVAPYVQMRRAVADHWRRDADFMAAIDAESTALAAAPPFPPQFAGLPANRVFDLPWSSLAHESPVELVDDPQAAGGKAVCYAPRPEETTEESPRFGIYDRASGRSAPSIQATAKDGRYHWYDMGTFTLGTNSIIWGHETWYLTAAYLASAYLNSADPTPNTWRFYISVKATGPNYEAGAAPAAPRRIYVDRVVLVRPE